MGGANGDSTTTDRHPLRRLLSFITLPYRSLARLLHDLMPRGLYGRALLIILTPIVLLQSVIAFVFMERHWQTVTNRLSQATTRDIAAIISVIETYPHGDDYAEVIEIARRDLELAVSILPGEPLPPPAPKPFFSLLDRALSGEISQRIGKPFWIDTVGRSDLVEIRIQLTDVVLRVFARRSQTYASNSHIFVVWMLGSSLVLVGVAVLFLRNQIRPIQRLADAAESFGRGHPVADLTPRGSREIRLATEAFVEMSHRIERQIEQRTVMLAGVSHDLRTILTRFRLELALIGEGPEIEALTRDVDDMQAMLEAYLTFAKGDRDEAPQPVDIALMIEEAEAEAEVRDAETKVRLSGDPIATVKPNAFKRLLLNLVSNAASYGDHVEITADHSDRWLTLTVDDDGPGIPADEREAVFRPFYRLDTARNQDRIGTGLGLAIARDIARGHGGDITLADSPIGGLRAVIRIPT
ncbi:MAG: two-component sensor histidine kinase [Hyphomicrobiales bacterium]|nr:MAG: two-component sensor histidine kinase [Hyphomicrobiales bacterium]